MRGGRRATALCLLLAALAIAPAALAAGPPRLQSRAAVLMDARSGQLLFAQREQRRAAIASTTKIMTALLTLEQAKLTDRFTAPPYRPAPAESRIDLRSGERMSVRDLLNALLLESANDAAVTLAVGVAGSRAAFVREMNERARQLGLRDTHYANPIGLDQAGNYSSAQDLARLARLALRDPTFARIVDSPSATLASGERVRRVENRNVLVGRYPFVDGVKTGYTIEAGNVLVGAGRRHGVQLVSVVLGEPTEEARNADTLALLRYGFSQYRVYRPVSRGAQLAAVEVRYRDRSVPLVASSSYVFTARRGEQVRAAVDAPPEVDGTAAGEPLGRVRVLVGGKQVGLVTLVAKDAVEPAGALDKARHFLLRPLTLVALLAMVSLGAFAIVRRARLR